MTFDCCRLNSPSYELKSCEKTVSYEELNFVKIKRKSSRHTHLKKKLSEEAQFTITE